MKEVKPIVAYKDCGHIVANITPLMKKAGISKTKLSKLTGLHHNTISDYMSGNITRYDDVTLSKFCYAFNCKTDDILVYVAPEEK